MENKKVEVLVVSNLAEAGSERVISLLGLLRDDAGLEVHTTDQAVAFFKALRDSDPPRVVVITGSLLFGTTDLPGALQAVYHGPTGRWLDMQILIHAKVHGKLPGVVFLETAGKLPSGEGLLLLRECAAMVVSKEIPITDVVTMIGRLAKE